MKGTNLYDADIAGFKPDGRGGYSQPDVTIERDDDTIDIIGASCSEEGMYQLRELRRIQRHWQPVLDAWHEHFGSHLCRHGVPLDEFTWTINDYCYDDVGEPAHWQQQTVFILCDGFHGEDYCIVAEFTPRLLAFTWFLWGDEYVPQLAPELTR